MREDVQALASEIRAFAPMGWFSFHLYASTAKQKIPPPPRRGLPSSDRYEELREIMRDARREEKGKRKNWESGQILRGFDPVQPGQPTAPAIWDRTDRRNFAGLPFILRDLIRTLPDAGTVSVVWMIHPPFLAEDLRREESKQVAPIDTPQGQRELLRLHATAAISADPSWAPDYDQLCALFPLLAPRMRQDGTPIKDRARLVREIIADVRRAIGVKAPPKVSARSLLDDMFASGMSRLEASARLKLAGWSVSDSYVSQVYRDWKRTTEPEIEIQPGMPLIIELERGSSPVDIEIPDGYQIAHRPAPTAEPVIMRPIETDPEASPERTAKALLRGGSTYEEIREALAAEKGRIVPDASLRRMATELRKADSAIPLEMARSRSDVARALIRDGLSYDQIERTMMERGEKPLSRGQLRAIKANLKG